MRPYRHPRLWLFVLLVILTLGMLAGERKLASTTLMMVDQPQLSPPSGHYSANVLVRMTTPDPTSKVLYTTDGTEPRPENAAVYDRPLPLDAAESGVTIVSARLQWADGSLGPVTRTTYFMLDTSLPVLSLAVEPADLTDPQTGLLTNPRQRGVAWERPAHATYLDTTGEAAVIGFSLPIGLRIHGNNSRNYDKKSWRLYFRSEYGQNRLNYPLFEPLPNQPTSDGYKRLVLHSGSQEFAAPGWTLLRRPLLEWLGAQTHVTVAPSRPVLLFINGESQGIYLLYQRIDDWYFADAHDIQVVEPAMQDALWQELWTYIEQHDMRDPTAYAYVTERINIDNFIDYHLLQLYAGNTDWIYANVRSYLPADSGGQWHWLFWDLDWVFGLDAGSGPDFNMMDRFFETDDPAFLRGSLPLRRLMENPEFYGRFLARADELLNTILNPTTVTARLDKMAAEMAPDVAYEYSRWPSPTTWEAGVADMRTYLAERPFHFRTHIIDQFGLAGNASLTLAAPTAGKGQVAVGDWLLPPDWTGTYFLDTTVTVTAVPDVGYRFSGWEEPNLPNTAVFDWLVVAEQTFTPRFERLDADAWRVGDVAIVAVGSGRHPQVDVRGDWVELRVQRPSGVDLRGWRLTDADHKTGGDEGTLQFADVDALAWVPFGTRLIVVMDAVADDRNFKRTDRNVMSGVRLLFAGNEQIGGPLAYRFHLGTQDNIALLAPGSTTDFADDVGIDFYSVGMGLPATTPASFGILQDGVTAGMQRLVMP